MLSSNPITHRFWRSASAALLALTLATGALAQDRSGGTLNWIVSPEPASIVPLTTTAGAKPQVTILAKKVKNYAPTAEGIRGSFSELYLQE